MKRKRFRGLSFIAGLMTVAMTMTACGGDSGESSEGGDKDLTIGYIAWDENIAMANLFKVQLEQRGYSVDLQQLDAAPTFQALSQGDIDLFQDAWLPVTHEDYWEQYKDQVEDLGTWYTGATLNIAVPAYVDEVDSIADLAEHADMFDGTITGIEPGAGISRITQDAAIPGYGLDGKLSLQTSSTTAMLTELDSAIAAEEPIVVTLWHPHWAYSRYDLKDLEDPEGHMGEGEEIHNLGRQGFSEDFPELAEMLKSFTMSDEMLASLEDAIQQAGTGNELQAVEEWSEENKEALDEIFGDL